MQITKMKLKEDFQHYLLKNCFNKDVKNILIRYFNELISKDNFSFLEIDDLQITDSLKQYLDAFFAQYQ
jgi:hypothetical protein